MLSTLESIFQSLVNKVGICHDNMKKKRSFVPRYNTLHGKLRLVGGEPYQPYNDKLCIGWLGKASNQHRGGKGEEWQITLVQTNQ